MLAVSEVYFVVGGLEICRRTAADSVERRHRAVTRWVTSPFSGAVPDRGMSGTGLSAVGEPSRPRSHITRYAVALPSMYRSIEQPLERVALGKRPARHCRHDRDTWAETAGRWSARVAAVASSVNRRAAGAASPSPCGSLRSRDVLLVPRRDL